MRVYSPNTNKGRVCARDDVQKKTADGGRSKRDARARTLRKAARSKGKRDAMDI